MPGEDSVTLADVQQFIAAEHHATNEKLELIRAEGREREREFTRGLARIDESMRAYVDDAHREIKQGVLNETDCLQSGLDKLHNSIFGNGKMEESIAYRLKAAEVMQARWEKIVNRIVVGIGIPLTLAIGGALWMLISKQWELVVH